MNRISRMGKKPRVVVLPEEIIAMLIAFITQLTMYAVNSDVSTVGLNDTQVL